MKNVNFGIIGCGMIADWHAAAIRHICGAELAGVADANGEAAASFGCKYHTFVFSSVDELLCSAQVDVVCICTPSGLHAPLAIKAADCGKHVIVEKPMALNPAEADEIIKACERNHVKLAVISQLRFTDAVSRLKSAVENNLLGRLVMGDICMKFYRPQEYYDSSRWRGTWGMDGGGALMNQGIHGIDLLQYIMGPVKSVSAYIRTLSRKIEVEDTAVAAVEFQNGALGMIQGTTSIYPGSPRRLEINGDRGTIILEEDCIVLWEIQGQSGNGDVIKDRTSMGTSSNPAAFSIDGHVMQISDMLDSVLNDRQPLVDQYEGRKPVEIINAIYESSRTGKPVYLKGNYNG